MSTKKKSGNIVGTQRTSTPMPYQQKFSIPRPVPGERVVATYEPETAINWPHGHVSVEQTGMDVEECFKVTIHGVDHYLHATTAYELQKMLDKSIKDWDKNTKRLGSPGVL